MIHTSVNNAVKMTIFQSRPYLPCKFPCYTFSQPSMTDYVVQHLPSINILEDHVVVVLMNDELSHAAYIRVI